MKRHIHIIFLLNCLLSFGQPPVERNSAVRNSIGAESTVNEHENKEASTQSSEMLQSIDEFINLHTQANTLPNQKNPSVGQQNQMNHFVSQKKKENTDGFDYHLSAFMAGNYDISQKEHLEKARSLHPENQQVLIQSVGLNYIIKNKQILASDLKILKKQTVWSEDELNYARDVLISVVQYGNLITHGIKDTYPILYLQYVEHLRKDVNVIPMQLLQSEAYRNHLSEIGFKLPESKIIDTKFIRDFSSMNNPYNLLYFSLTIPRDYFSGMEQNLYPVGLTFNFAGSGFLNSKVNLLLWEKELKKSILQQAKDKNGKQLSANYLPMLVNLYKYYESNNNSKELDNIKAAIKQIGTNIGKTHLLNELDLSK